jgi:acyl-coenzyme A synthetase/AMP-(fatty) acid ligase
VVGGLLPRIPELLVAALGAWRIGAIYQPLFTAFGPAAIAGRVTAPGGSHAKLIVTVRWPLRMLLNVALYMLSAIDLRPEDHYWNVADPGWTYGMAFAVIGPLRCWATPSPFSRAASASKRPCA